MSANPTWDPDLLHEMRNAPQLFAAIARRDGLSELKLQKQLRLEFAPELVRAAMTLDALRTRAAAKISRAATMWFDRVGLEQATAEDVARHKAERFREGQARTVADLCCGIGADAIALAEHAEVLAVDLHPSRCLMTKWNAETCGVASRVRTVCADVASLVDLPPLVHIDPDRRGGGRRSLRVEDSVPGLDFLRDLPRRCEGGAIKLSPASNFAGQFEDVEFELVSLHGECKECTVWFGSLAEPGLWRATALPGGESLAGRPMDALAETGTLQRYLYDPDPAIVRAGLVDMLGEQFGLFRLDAEEEYLTGDVCVDSPLLSRFEVEAELPNNLRDVRRHFRTAGFQQVEIKCRRIPIRAEEVRRKLPLHGRRPGVLIFARIGGKARAVVAERR